MESLKMVAVFVVRMLHFFWVTDKKIASCCEFLKTNFRCSCPHCKTEILSSAENDEAKKAQSQKTYKQKKRYYWYLSVVELLLLLCSRKTEQ